MSIEEKVNQVIKLFHVVDADVHRFKSRSGLRCLRLCSRCCHSSKVTATILECLPLVYWLYQKNMAEDWLMRLEEPLDLDMECCLFLKNSKNSRNIGRCSVYALRPLICRFFGFSAMMDKNDQPKLFTCQVIKKVYSQKYNEAVKTLKQNEAPVMRQYFMMLYTIDPVLAREHFPLPVAFKKTLEMLLYYFSNRLNSMV